MNNYSAYIFDMDGTLVQSEALKSKALSEACKYFGSEVNIETYKDVMGESWEVVTNYFFVKGKFKPDNKKFNMTFQIIYQKLINEELQLSPNVKTLIEKLISKKKKLGIVSSAPLWSIEQIINKFNLQNSFDVIISKEDVKNHKPDPEAYLLALEKLSTTGNNVLVFEDSNAGLKSANRAGCKTIAFRHEFNVKNNLERAIRIISDFKEINLL